MNFISFKRVKNYAGYENELKVIKDILSRYHLAIIHGHAGIGKTSLAVQYFYINKKESKFSLLAFNDFEKEQLIAGFNYYGRKINLNFRASDTDDIANFRDGFGLG